MSTGEVVTIGDYERLKQQVSLQPCGHPYAAVRQGEEWRPGEFTQWCGWCADIDGHRRPLQAIARLVRDWSSDNRGGLAVQRQRWKLLGRIAREALGEA